MARTTVWRDEGSRRVVSFYDLPPAEYVFRVRAANNDGVWNDSGASLAFAVQPYLWQTTGFRLGLVLLLFSTGGGIVWSVGRSKHRRELAELERTARQQKELAHLSRVTMLGELSGSMAHELNQPLAAILSNAQAALRFLARGDADLAKCARFSRTSWIRTSAPAKSSAACARSSRRARCIGSRSTSMTSRRKCSSWCEGDLVNHGVTTRTELAPDLPMVRGDRVQLQQVLLNLVMNASDAMSGKPAGDRRLIVRTERSGEGGVRVSVCRPRFRHGSGRERRGCSSRSSPPRPRAWAWGCRCAARSSRRTAARLGLPTTRTAARRFVSRCPSSGERQGRADEADGLRRRRRPGGAGRASRGCCGRRGCEVATFGSPGSFWNGTIRARPAAWCSTCRCRA